MLENQKKNVCLVAKKAQKENLCIHMSGNFSILDKETNYIVVTPSGVDRETLSYDDMIVMDTNGTIIENKSNLKPSSETLVHMEIYKQRKDINAIAHTHSSYATTMAILNKKIPAIVYECGVLKLTKGYVPIAPYGRPGTIELAQSVIDVCKEADVFLLEKHGAVTVGKDMDDAYLKAVYLEEIAKLYHLSLTISDGSDINPFTQEELDAWKYPNEFK